MKMCEHLKRAPLGLCGCYEDTGLTPACGTETLESNRCPHIERTCHVCPDWDKELGECVCGEKLTEVPA